MSTHPLRIHSGMAISKKSAVKAPSTTARKKAAKSATAEPSRKREASPKKAGATKTASKTAAKPKIAAKTAGESAPSRDKKTKDPRGGLTRAGREYFAKTEGAHLKPGVKGAADTPEKKKRKGSFLRRHFANPRGPMEKDGKPTRLALSAQAWGERLPKTAADAAKLAAKGKKLLEQYQSGKTAGS